jgi:Protein of unknown function (DUF2568)
MTARPPAHDRLPGGIHGVIAVFSFVLELAMLGILAVAGLHLGSSTAVHVALAIAAPGAAIAIWGRLMAPTSRHRLGDPARLVAQVVLFVATAVAAAAARHALVGIVFAVLAIGTFALTRLAPERRAR